MCWLFSGFFFLVVAVLTVEDILHLISVRKMNKRWALDEVENVSTQDRREGIRD